MIFLGILIWCVVGFISSVYAVLKIFQEDLTVEKLIECIYIGLVGGLIILLLVLIERILSFYDNLKCKKYSFDKG